MEAQLYLLTGTYIMCNGESMARKTPVRDKAQLTATGVEGTGGRLVKFFLPSNVVHRMDLAIQNSNVYADRTMFVVDALESFLAELLDSEMAETHDDAGGDSQRYEPLDPILGRSLVEVVGFRAEDASLPAPSAPASAPTWGMHNRDFPTIWAAALLGRAVSTAGPVRVEDWLAEVGKLAWQLAEALRFDTSVDLSGFPFNPQKAASAESRFRSFFLCTTSGVGPLISLGLATLDDDSGRLSLSRPGAQIIASLIGLRPSPDSVTTERRNAWIQHLASFVPEDFDFLSEIVQLIDAGSDSRSALLESVRLRHPDWNDSVTSSNVAGFIGRAREWRLVEGRLVGGRYQLVDDALQVLSNTKTVTTKEGKAS